MLLCAAQGPQGLQQSVVVPGVPDGQAEILLPAQLGRQVLHQDAAVHQQVPGDGLADRPPSSSTMR